MYSSSTFWYRKTVQKKFHFVQIHMWVQNTEFLCLSVQAAHPASTNTHVQLDVSTSTASYKMSQRTSVRCNFQCWRLQPNMQNNNSILWLGATVNETFKKSKESAQSPSPHKYRSGSNRLLHFLCWISMLVSPLPLRIKLNSNPVFKFQCALKADNTIATYPDFSPRRIPYCIPPEFP